MKSPQSSVKPSTKTSYQSNTYSYLCHHPVRLEDDVNSFDDQASITLHLLSIILFCSNIKCSSVLSFTSFTTSCAFLSCKRISIRAHDKLQGLLSSPISLWITLDTSTQNHQENSTETLKEDHHHHLDGCTTSGGVLPAHHLFFLWGPSLLSFSICGKLKWHRTISLSTSTWLSGSTEAFTCWNTTLLL